MMDGKNMNGCKDGVCGSGCGGMCGGRGCGCLHHNMFPFLIIVFGILFLGEAYNWVMPATVAIVWPILVILAGLTKLFKGMCKCC